MRWLWLTISSSRSQDIIMFLNPGTGLLATAKKPGLKILFLELSKSTPRYLVRWLRRLKQVFCGRPCSISAPHKIRNAQKLGMGLLTHLLESGSCPPWSVAQVLGLTPNNAASKEYVGGTGRRRWRSQNCPRPANVGGLQGRVGEEVSGQGL